MGLQGREEVEEQGFMNWGGEWFHALILIERSRGIDTLEFLLCLCSYHAPCWNPLFICIFNQIYWRFCDVNVTLKSFWQCTGELTQNGINSDTEKDQLCVFSSPDCQSNRCCLSSPWQVTNYAKHQQAPSQSIYLDNIITISRATPDAPGMSRGGGGGHLTQKSTPFHLSLSILTF